MSTVYSDFSKEEEILISTSVLAYSIKAIKSRMLLEGSHLLLLVSLFHFVYYYRMCAFPFEGLLQ